MSGSAPRFDADRKNLDLAWLQEVLGYDVQSVKTVPVKDVGGFMGDMARIFVTAADGSEKRLIFKQLLDEKLPSSKAIGCAREAFFYNSDLAKTVACELAEIFYAYGDMATGEKYLLMEDLSDGVQAGLLYGPANPNNWAKKQAGELEKIEAAHLKDGLTVESITVAISKSMARIHSANWRNAAILENSWLRGREWWQKDDSKQWQGLMNGANANWEKVADVRAANPDIWTEELNALVNASFSRVSFEDYLAFTKETAWTLVHGDFHPANVMWVGGDKGVKLVDWEMVGVGNGAQEIGQYMVSHMDPKLRKECEERVLRAYYDELVAGGVDDYTWERCWKDYVEGGIGRWAWFIKFLAGMMPPPLVKFFNEQFLAFARDHHITPENIVQPRV